MAGLRLFASKALIVLLATFALVVILPDAGRVVPFLATISARYPLGEFDFEVDNDGKVIEVETGQENPQVKVGDRIDLSQTPDRRVASGPIAFVSCRDKPDSKTSSPCTKQFKFRVISNGQGRTVPIPPEAKPLYDDEKFGTLISAMSVFFTELFGVYFIVLCSIQVWKHPTPQTWSLFLYSVWFNPGQYFFWYAHLSIPGLRIFDALQAFFEPLGLTSILCFAIHFPRDTVTGWRRNWFWWLLPVFLMLWIVRTLTFANFFWGWRTDRLYYLWFALAGCVLVAICAVFHETSRTADPGDHKAIKLVWYATVIGLSCWLLADLGESTGILYLAHLERFDREDLLNFFYAVAVATPIVFIYVVLYYRLIEPKYAVSFGILFPMFFITFTFAEYVADHYLENYLGIVAGIPLVVIVEALFATKFERWWEDRFDRLHERVKPADA